MPTYSTAAIARLYKVSKNDDNSSLNPEIVKLIEHWSQFRGMCKYTLLYIYFFFFIIYIFIFIAAIIYFNRIT